jgi:hypothetical protein
MVQARAIITTSSNLERVLQANLRAMDSLKYLEQINQMGPLLVSTVFLCRPSGGMCHLNLIK